MSDARRTRSAVSTQGLGIGVDLALCGVTAAVAVSLVRAFRTWDELWPLLFVVVAAHGLSFAARRLRLGATTATLGLLVLGAVIITAVYYRDLSWYGVPNGDVLTRALDDARAAFGPFQKLVAPVDALPGFTVTFALGLWLIALFADLAAARSDAPLQAIAPHVAVFVFSSVLLLGRQAVTVTAIFVGALVVYRLAVRAARVRSEGGEDASAQVLWLTGVPALVVVLLAGALFSQAAPTTRGGVVDLRSIGRGPKARVVESPLVSLDSLLGTRSDTVLFTVRSPTAHYWRLTALDDFDGRSWSASAKYRDLDSDERIGTAWARGVEVTRIKMRFALAELASDWLPTAFSPTSVDAPVGLRFDDASSSVFVADGESTERIVYDVESEIASPDRGSLQAAPSPVDSSFEDFLALPGSFPDEAAQLARDLTAGMGPFDAAAALERFFRSDRFVYDREANYRDSADPLMEFLQRGRGFCQQFATAFAAMARSVGLPSRVAVGFTYGEPTTTVEPSGEERTTWTVRGRYAHAWPEVYIHDIGWVAFEPTPGRGNPDAGAYSSAAPAQSDANGGSVGIGETLATTTTTTTIVPAGGPVPTTLPDEDPGRPDAAEGTTTEEGTSNSATIVLFVIVAAALAVIGSIRLRVLAVRHRRKQRRRGTTPGERVAASWRAACQDLARVDVRALPSETPTEFAARAGRIVEVHDLGVLARHESDRRFRRAPLDESEAESAEAVSDGLREIVWSRLDRRQRLAAELDAGARDDR